MADDSDVARRPMPRISEEEGSKRRELHGEELSESMAQPLFSCRIFSGLWYILNPSEGDKTGKGYIKDIYICVETVHLIAFLLLGLILPGEAPPMCVVMMSGTSDVVFRNGTGTRISLPHLSVRRFMYCMAFCHL